MDSTPSPKKSFMVRYVAIALFLLGAAGGVLFFRARKVDYVIPVESVTMYRENVIHYPRAHHGGVALVVSLLRYWGDDIDFDNAAQIKEIRPMFNDDLGPQADVMRAYFEKYGYTFTQEILQTPTDIKKYINAHARTPLFFNIGFSVKVPTLVDYHLLVGIKEKERKVVFHHFTLGTNYEMDFDDFEKLWAAYPNARFRKRYFIIQPKNLSERLAEISKRPVPELSVPTALVEKLVPILPDYILGMRTTSNVPAHIPHFEKLLANPAFTFLHPVYQVSVYSRFADWQIKTGLLADDREARLSLFADARKNIQKAYELNHDLDQSYGEWPGVYRFGTLPFPDEVSAFYYRTVGDEAQAARYMREAEKIYDASRAAIGLLPCEFDCYRFIRPLPP